MGRDLVELQTAANGRAWITTHSRRRRLWLGFLLTFRYGFYRWGAWIPPIADEGIYPDFIRGRLRIHAGYDNWVGYDLLASNADADAFLRRFFQRHCARWARLPGA